jgi:predicted DNA-binding transcriptional regulator AlpA
MSSPGKSNKLQFPPGESGRIQPLATDAEFCEYAGLTAAQSAQLRWLGDGPPFVKVTGRQVRYDWADILAWVAERKFSRTAEQPRRDQKTTKATTDTELPAVGTSARSRRSAQ